LHHWDCPNLLWELMRTRRVKLTAQQLLSRNTAEAIVDKDNHASDAMKYHLMSHPEPSTKSFGRRVNERLSELQKVDPTFAALKYPAIMREEQQEEDYEPELYTRRERPLIRQWLCRQRGCRW
jgi:hypothetical protein